MPEVFRAKNWNIVLILDIAAKSFVNSRTKLGKNLGMTLKDP
jgi:hypothetical protein